ncbi:MAG: 2-C-methyl-D-erythritol 2,4-cyclodiphosphate synthase [Actinomycetaceae bacterium]|nr:2-C-methyl-D-erythritol 2,4-cyclodiphosphate synthase [Actinomycetaceae bacterium]
MTTLPPLRTGIGFDTHAFAPADSDRPMWLACLHWPGEVGLEGHSDADAAAHACCDALLAAAGLGDLGTHFGTSRPQWAGASGEELLRETLRLLHADGWEVVNVSVQVIGNRPRLGKRRAQAAAKLTEVIGAPVNLAASTTDGLGFTGRGEGVTAIASALVTRPGGDGA